MSDDTSPIPTEPNEDPGTPPSDTAAAPIPEADDLDVAREEPTPASETEAEAPAPSMADVVAALGALGDRLDARLDALRTQFDREVRAEATRERVVDRLHAELQEYKRGLIQGVLQPVFVDLIQLHDDIGKLAVAPADAAPEVVRMIGLMDGFRQGVEDILYRQGVEPFEVEGEAFDPKRQRALTTVPTDDPGRARTVAARIRKGFQAGDRVIRPEIVSVYAFKG